MAGIGSSLFKGFTGSSKIYGKKPKIPGFPTLEDAQSKAIQANIKTLPEAQALTSSTNTFNQNELNKLLDLALPGGREQITGTISSLLKGEVPKDVADFVSRSAAQRAVGGGFAGSQAASNLTTRDLGITSLQATQAGFDSAQQWLAGALAPRFDVTNMFISPTQRYAAGVDTWNRDLMAAKVEAAPNPGDRGTFDSTMALVGMVLSAYGGGAGYQNTYKPDYGGGGGGGGGGGFAGPGGGPGQAPNTGGWFFGNQNSGWGFGKSGGGSWFTGQAPGPG